MKNFDDLKLHPAIPKQSIKKLKQLYENPWFVKGWDPMIFIKTGIDNFDYMEQTKVDIYKNKLYICYKSIKGLFYCLRIFRHDLKPVHEWSHLQQIKNDICGPEAEGIELYPAESRITDLANHYHLYILREGKFPFGGTLRQVNLRDQPK